MTRKDRAARRQLAAVDGATMERRTGPRTVALNQALRRRRNGTRFCRRSIAPRAEFFRAARRTLPLPKHDADIAFAHRLHALALDRIESDHLRAG